jgi:transcriptional regulator with XRE-family HTH domain
MNVHLDDNATQLNRKIKRLVQERGWNYEEFARIAGLNRQTVRSIMDDDTNRHLRNATIGACAGALNLPVSDLIHMPLERLLPRMRNSHAYQNEDSLSKLYEQASQPDLIAWIERNTERAKHLDDGEIVELVSQQGPDGPLSKLGVEHCVSLIERKRRLIQQVQHIAGTEYLELLEKMVALMHEKVQPYRDRNP